MLCWARRSISSPWSVLCHPEWNEGSQGLYYRPPPRRPRDSSLRSEWQHRTSLLITNCSLLIIWDCHGLFQASQWRDLYNTCHTLSHLSHYPTPCDCVILWFCDFWVALSTHVTLITHTPPLVTVWHCDNVTTAATKHSGAPLSQEITLPAATQI